MRQAPRKLRSRSLYQEKKTREHRTPTAKQPAYELQKTLGVRDRCGCVCVYLPTEIPTSFLSRSLAALHSGWGPENTLFGYACVGCRSPPNVRGGASMVKLAHRRCRAIATAWRAPAARAVRQTVLMARRIADCLSPFEPANVLGGVRASLPLAIRMDEAPAASG